MPSLARSEPVTADGASDPRARLRDIIAARSFRLGQMFRLVSGVESNVYFNMKPTMFDPEGAALMARLVVERLAAAGASAVGGLEMGAVPIVAAATVQSQLAGRPIQGFFVRKKAKEHGAKLRIEGLAAGESLKAKRVAIIDDVCTTGGSALSAIDEVRAEGGEIVLVLAIVDREEGAERLDARARPRLRRALPRARVHPGGLRAPAAGDPLSLGALRPRFEASQRRAASHDQPGAPMTIQRIEPGPRMSQAVIHGNTVYLAGQVARNAAGQERHRADEGHAVDHRRLLAQAGTDKSKLLSANIWLSDMAKFNEMNAVWDGWVSPGNTPARATVEAKLASPQYTSRSW